MQPVARVLQHYYQVILGNFEELYRKNVVEQQRKALVNTRSSAPPQGASASGSQPIGSLQTGQQDTSAVVNVMSMMGQSISNAPSTGLTANSAATQPQQQNDIQRQPSSTPSMSGAIPNVDGTSGQISISGYPAQPSVKIPSETEQDGLSNKRKLESEEADVKRARQKTGQPPPPVHSMNEGLTNFTHVESEPPESSDVSCT